MLTITSDDVSGAMKVLASLGEATLVYSFGLWNTPKLTQQEIGETLGIDRRAVGSLKRLALAAMRAALPSRRSV